MSTNAQINKDTVAQVGAMIGFENMADLLAELPDEFYYLTAAAQSAAWKVILAAVNHGEYRPQVLAQVWNQPQAVEA